MKTFKRISCLLLALALMMALSVTAFAANVTVEDKAILNGHSFTAFQVFTGREENGILSDVEWGNGINSAAFLTALKADTTFGSKFTDCGTAAAVADVLGKNNTDTALANAVAKLAYANKTGDGTALTAGENTLDDGYYLIVDTTADVGAGGAYNAALLQVVGNINIKAKTDAPSTEKKILDTNPVDVNEASIGDTVDYQITGTLPANLNDYNTYYYVFTDTLSKGLTFNDDVKVEIVNGETKTDVTKYFYADAAEYSVTDGTTITVGIQDIKALSLLEGVTVTEVSKIVVTYSATLNENAVIAGEGNPNDVVLDYSNDPNNSGKGTTTTPPPENPGKPNPTDPTGETPKDTVVTYTTELTILKNDDKNNILTGAEFTLTGNGVKVVLVTTEKFTVAADGTYWKLKDGTYTKAEPTDDTRDNYAEPTSTKYAKTVELVAKDTNHSEVSAKGTVDSETGLVTFTGLGAGTYTITETKTPAGYNTIAPVTFTLTFDAGTKTFVSDNEDVVVGEDNKLDTTIVNKAGATLPETGGIGTTIFYVLGSVLLVGAAVLLITKKRMSAEK